MENVILPSNNFDFRHFELCQTDEDWIDDDLISIKKSRIQRKVAKSCCQPRISRIEYGKASNFITFYDFAFEV